MLGKEPIKTDMLVVRVKDKIPLKNEIAKDFFRGHNILEYKSPSDEVNTDTLYKIISYAALYKAETGKYVDAVKEDDITMTIVREGKPRKLLNTLSRKGCTITTRCNGIYEIAHLIFPLQIVVAKELDEEGHVWLKSLTRQITIQRAISLATQYRKAQKTGTKRDRQNAEAVIDLVSHATDVDLARDVKEDGIMTIMELAVPKIEEARKEERRNTEAAIRDKEAAIRSKEAAIILGIRNMAELFFQFGQQTEVAKEAIMKKYPDVNEDIIASIISEIYNT